LDRRPSRRQQEDKNITQIGNLQAADLFSLFCEGAVTSTWNGN
jgi:hypothetical protein